MEVFSINNEKLHGKNGITVPDIKQFITTSLKAKYTTVEKCTLIFNKHIFQLYSLQLYICQ